MHVVRPVPGTCPGHRDPGSSDRHGESAAARNGGPVHVFVERHDDRVPIRIDPRGRRRRPDARIGRNQGRPVLHPRVRKAVDVRAVRALKYRGAVDRSRVAVTHRDGLAPPYGGGKTGQINVSRFILPDDKLTDRHRRPAGGHLEQFLGRGAPGSAVEIPVKGHSQIGSTVKHSCRRCDRRRTLRPGIVGHRAHGTGPIPGAMRVGAPHPHRVVGGVVEVPEGHGALSRVGVNRAGSGQVLRTVEPCRLGNRPFRRPRILHLVAVGAVTGRDQGPLEQERVAGRPLLPQERHDRSSTRRVLLAVVYPYPRVGTRRIVAGEVLDRGHVVTEPGVHVGHTDRLSPDDGRGQVSQHELVRPGSPPHTARPDGPAHPIHLDEESVRNRQAPGIPVDGLAEIEMDVSADDPSERGDAAGGGAQRGRRGVGLCVRRSSRQRDEDRPHDTHRRDDAERATDRLSTPRPGLPLRVGKVSPLSDPRNARPHSGASAPRRCSP